MIPEKYRSLPALSIRQPWPWLILNCGKRHENRQWPSHYAPIKFRGPFLMHASKGCTRAEYIAAKAFAYQVAGIKMDIPDLDHWEIQRGGIVGAAVVTGWVDHSDSPWATGPGLVLDEVVELPFTPCKGMLGFFKPVFG